MKMSYKVGAVGCLAAAVVFYTISGVMIATNKEEVKNLSSHDEKFKESTAPNTMDDIQMAARVLPSQNDEFTSKLMTATNSTSSFTSFYGEGVSDDLADARFEVSNFDEYFPKLNFKQEYVPEGSSSPFCLHLDWIKKEQA
jgi:hypothetical protein